MSRFQAIELKSGFTMSVQASMTNYCEPRNNVGPYISVEIGFPNAPEPLIIGYAEDPDNPTETVYGWVPSGLLKALFVKHGGIENGECPPLDMNPENSVILAEAMIEIENESC